MQVIITHELADFDALASLLAMHLVDHESIPVLPYRINRNVKAFLTLYGVDLPFVEAKDLPGKSIEMLTLVDTQSLPSMRGLTEATAVRCFDHHPWREDHPSSWTYSVQPVGATVTILVDKLQEADVEILPVHATLLLLGIYEDTGSLTYSQTTPRDLHAAGYLLSFGADLSKVGEFLRHPLSNEQNMLYTTLIQAVETHQIHGQRIALAVGDARGFDEELSTVAHKLRETLEPSALFMLVETRAGVQLIARSNSEQIDASAVAQHFQGGGHSRASAALIQTKGLQEVRAELLDVLKQVIQPAMSVAQLMSHGMQALAPDTPVSAAQEKMQRFGFEGYPVVDQGRVVGLLTRRAVDRAISHKLNLPASSLMSAGSYVVHPDDSIEVVRQMMITSGWGQLPVADPRSERLIGIVTRTDLIHAYGTGSHPQRSRLNFARQLEAGLPAARLALLKTVAREAVENHLRIYIVGGFVRDLILNRPGLDFDIVVEGDAIQLARSLANHYGGKLITHGRFGTAKWNLPCGFILEEGLLSVSEDEQASSILNPIDAELPAFLDFVTARTEFYTSPSALPTVESASIKLDLHRRDFTINTLALRLDGYHFGDILDFWGGLQDLQHGLVRVLHSLSFVDDPTRIIRAVRFEQRFGFHLEERTQQLLSAALDLIGKLSGDRIYHELEHILDEQKAIPMLTRLAELDILNAIHPALKFNAKLAKMFSQIPFDQPQELSGVPVRDLSDLPWPKLRKSLLFGLWLVNQPEATIRSMVERIRHPAQEVEAIIQARRIGALLPGLAGAKPSAIAGKLAGPPLMALMIALYNCEQEEARTVLCDYLNSYRFVLPTFTGNDILERGIRPGPVFKDILGQLRSAWLDGQIANTLQEKELFEILVQQALKVQKGQPGGG